MNRIDLFFLFWVIVFVLIFFRHPRERGDPCSNCMHPQSWIPAFAGMTDILFSYLYKSGKSSKNRVVSSCSNFLKSSTALCPG